jgi:tetratricopeptide (TPR) repeat protein
MLHLAVAAQEVAAELKASDPGNLGGAAVADLQARALGELANAYRILGLNDQASAALSEAFDRLLFGSRDPFLRSHLDELEAAQLAEVDPETALERLSCSIDLYRSLGDGHLAGRVRIAQSIYMALTGKPEEALRLNAEGLARIDRRRDPLLLKTGLHNRLLLLLGMGRQEEARQTLAQCRGLGFRALCAVTVRLWWMEGRVCQSLGELEPAEEKLDWARCGLAVLDLLYYAGVASLDLAATRLRLGRPEDARESVETAHLAFQAADESQDLQGVMVRLERALRKGEVTRDLLERTLVSLRRDEITGGLAA